MTPNRRPPRAPVDCPNLGSVIFVLALLKPKGTRLSLLKILNALALSSKPAFSPNTRIFGKVKRLPKDMSIPVYRGPRNEFRPTPGSGGVPLVDAVAGVKKLSPPPGKFPPTFWTVLVLWSLPAPPRYAAGRTLQI